MATKLKPTRPEARRLLSHLKQINELRWCGIDVGKTIDGEEIVDVINIKREKRLLIGVALPTFLVIKLAAVVEECTNILWTRRFPDIKKTRLSLEEKLKILAKIHDIDVPSVMSVWNLRHRCAHTPGGSATWEEYGHAFNKVWRFIGRYSGKLLVAPIGR